MATKLLDLSPQCRDAVLNAALKEFSLQGYDNASTNVIAKEAGISKALMFHYVSSKLPNSTNLRKLLTPPKLIRNWKTEDTINIQAVSPHYLIM